MDPYHQSNVRMPRACKRGRPAQAEAPRTQSRRGRKPKVSLPQMSSIPPVYAMGETNHPHQQILQQQQQQHQQQHQQHQQQQQQQQQQHQELAASYPRSESTRASAELAARQNLRYHTRAQVNQLSPPFITANQRSMTQSAANQILYPNISHVPRTTATYASPKQLSHITSRPYTRGIAHNLPVSTAPRMERYWQTNTHIPPVSTPAIQQTNKPAPVARPLPPQTIDQAVQTDCSLTDNEVKFMKTLRAKRMNIDDINIIIDKDDYIVTYNQPENQRDNLRLGRENLNAIVQQSDQFKATIALLASSFPRLPAPIVNPAIQYFAAQPSVPNTNALIPGVSPASPQRAQEAADNLTAPTEEPICTNGANVAQPQMAQQPNLANIQQYFPIPTIFNHNFGFQRPGQYVHNFSGGHHQSQNMNSYFHIPRNFLQNLTNPEIYDNRYDNRFVSPPTPPEESAMDNSFRWL